MAKSSAGLILAICRIRVRSPNTASFLACPAGVHLPERLAIEIRSVLGFQISESGGRLDLSSMLQTWL
jgi:hypothetical protein